MNGRAIIVILLGATLMMASQKTIMHGSAPTKSMSAREVFARASRSVVVVEVLDRDDQVIASGSGVVVAPGRIITNRHVADAGWIWRVKQGAVTSRAFVVWLDPDHDLAVLKTDDFSAPVPPTRGSDGLAVGERVYAIGAPRGLELTLSEGLISAIRSYADVQVIQTSAATSPGSSGGGLFDDQGRLVGVTTFTVREGQNLNFALPADLVIPLLRLPGPSAGDHSMRLAQSDDGAQSRAFRDAMIASKNLQTMVHERRLLHDESYTLPRTGRAASWLVGGATIKCAADSASAECIDNWPLWQKAALHMLQLRQEITAVGNCRDELESAFTKSAKSAWRALVDIYCRNRPGASYTDLEDAMRTCPASR